ncbi:hypothetical protein [Nocardia salmonicida]|uniref:hypothetical protein n=1 Tax=Nocardia salmonicida TaxID=53431 RepID=UPI0037B29844
MTHPTAAAATVGAPAGGPWLVWRLSAVSVPRSPASPDDLAPEEPYEFFGEIGEYEVLAAWLREWVRHGLDRATLDVRWIEKHSAGFVIRDTYGIYARATLTARESDTPPPPWRELSCCDREMSVIQHGDSPFVLCHECGHHEPRF